MPAVFILAYSRAMERPPRCGMSKAAEERIEAEPRVWGVRGDDLMRTQAQAQSTSSVRITLSRGKRAMPIRCALHLPNGRGKRVRRQMMILFCLAPPLDLDFVSPILTSSMRVQQSHVGPSDTTITSYYYIAPYSIFCP